LPVSFFGIVGLVSLAFSDQVTIEKTPFLGMSMTTVMLMFAASALLLVGGKILQRGISQSYPVKPRHYVRRYRR
jgi:hypothetical protein